MTVSSVDERLLTEGAAALGVTLTELQRGQLLQFVDLVYVWNRAAGLTTIARDNAVRLHVLDSLAAAHAVDSGPCLDLGTGAGLPGLVLAIARPEIRFVLAESNRRRCSFLLEVIRLLKLPNVKVLEGSVESLPRDEKYPTVISRAFRPPPEFLTIASGLVASEGRVVLMLADPSADELRELERGVGLALERSTRIVLPGGVEPRTIASFRSPCFT